MSVIVAVAAVVLAGVPLAYAVTRQWVVAVILAPLVAGLQCSAAVAAMITIGGPFALWAVVSTAGGWALAWFLARRSRAPLPGLDPVDLLVMYLPLLLPALLVRRPPVNWDARSIWWFHAAWFEQGAAVTREALGNPALAFSHPDYPPFAPATIAGVWTVTGGSGLWVAQVVSTLLTLSAVALLAYSVRHLVPGVAPMVARLVALAVALGVWSTAGYAVAAGYVDHLWAACVVAATVLLLMDRSVARHSTAVVGEDETVPDGSGGSGGRLALAVVLLAVATLSKNEGLVAAAIVAVLFTVRCRRNLARAAWVWVPVAVGLAWSVVVRRFGAASDLSSSPRLRQLTSGDLEPLDRAWPTVTALAGHVGWIVVGALVVTAIGLATLRRRRLELGLASVLWAWALALVFGVALVATYVISPYALEWHLNTSVDRVGVVLALLALVTTASWMLVAVAPDRGSRTDPSAAVPAAADQASGSSQAGW